MTSPFLDRLARGPVLADGALGTMLYARGIPFDHNFDELNLTQPKIVGSIHRDYLLAGADLIETNTFGANRSRLAPFGCEDKVRLIARQGARIARDAREVVGVPALVGGSMGPLGKPLAPFGTIEPAEAEGMFREAAEGLLEGGVDVFVLETFGDLNEIKAALAAVKSVCTLPVVALMTFGEDGRTPFGHEPGECYAALADAGADVIGANCSVGPQPTLDVLVAMRVAREARAAANGNARLPRLAAMPNAGLPQLVGGCCGTTPAHVAAMRADLSLGAAIEEAAATASGTVAVATPPAGPSAPPRASASPASTSCPASAATRTCSRCSRAPRRPPPPRRVRPRPSAEASMHLQGTTALALALVGAIASPPHAGVAGWWRRSLLRDLIDPRSLHPIDEVQLARGRRLGRDSHGGPFTIRPWRRGVGRYGA